MIYGSSSIKTSGRFLPFGGQSLSLRTATCQAVGCFAYGLIARAIVIQSQSNAYSAQTGVCCQIPRMDVGACTSDIYPDEERKPSDLFVGETQEKCSGPDPPPPFPSLRFSI